MTKEEYLLTVASEECAEVQQAVSKALRFGLKSAHPDTPHMTNSTQILIEYYQLEAVMKMLFDEGILDSFDFNERAAVWDNKEEKVKKYMDVSRGLGRLTDSEK